MNIVYTFDNNYFEVSLVSILSLLKTNKQINLYIIDCGIDKKNIKIIYNLCKKYDAKLVIREAKGFENRIPVKIDVLNWSFVCFIRLFFEELLPDLDRVLHIDCDTLVKGNLHNIYSIDLKDKICGGCYDCVPSTKKAAGLKKEDQYISNGFLLFNLDLMRKEHITEQFIQYIVDKKGILPHLDQDVLNDVLKNRIMILAPCYNVMSITSVYGTDACDFFDKKEPYYSKSEIREALDNPIIIHYVGYKYISRPWAQPCFHPNNKEWIHYYKELFPDGKLLKYKKKKGGLFREIFCYCWNLGNKNKFIRNIQWRHEYNKLNR